MLLYQTIFNNQSYLRYGGLAVRATMSYFFDIKESYKAIISL